MSANPNVGNAGLKKDAQAKEDDEVPPKEVNVVVTGFSVSLQ
jgi:hypothetical protein